MCMDPADGDGQLFDEEDVYEGHSQLRAIFGHDTQTVFDIIAGRRPHKLSTEEFADYEADPNAEEDSAREPSAGDKVASVDEPERLYLRYLRRPKPVSDSLLTQEAEWITEKLYEVSRAAPLFTLDIDSEVPPGEPYGKTSSIARGLFDDFPIADLFNDQRQRSRYDQCFKRSGVDPEDEHYEEKKSGAVFFPPNKSIEADVQEKVADCLRMLLNERVDVPFICVHRAHLLCPPLSPDVIWEIYELDLEFWQLKELREQVLQECLERSSDPRQIELVRQANSELVLRDYLTYEQSKKTVEPISSPGSGKRRRAQLTPEQMFNKYFTETGVRQHWFDFLPKPADLVAALIDDNMDTGEEGSGPSCHIPDPPEALQTSGVLSSTECRDRLNTWMKQLIASRSGEKLVIGDSDIADMVIRFEARQYALDPDFRNAIRRLFYADASITTLTTLKGEKLVDPGTPEWLGVRLMNKPLAQLWTAAPSPSPEQFVSACPWEQKSLQLEAAILANRHRELGLLVDQCEADKLINVIVHPLTKVDELPWTNLDRESTKYVLEKERWGRTDSEMYTKEQERLNAIYHSDLVKTARYVSQLATAARAATCETPWQWFLQRVLEHAVLAELIPVFRQELRAKLTTESEQYITKVCKLRLQLQLSARPLHYDLIPVEDDSLYPDFAALARSEADDMVDVLVEGSTKPPLTGAAGEDDLGAVTSAPLVYSLVIEPDGDCTKSSPVYLIMANREGLLVKTMTFPHLLEYVLGEADAPRPKDFENILLSLRTRPNAIAIPLINSLAIDLSNYVKNIADTRVRHPKHAWQIQFVPASVALLAANKATTMRTSESNSGQSLPVLLGLSSIHYIVEPIYETASLWSEDEQAATASNPLLSLPLHFLQHRVSLDRRKAALLEVLIRAVNTVGVFPNRLRVLSYLAPSLQFVSGLGPIKAKRILAAMLQPLSARETLLGLENRIGGRSEPGNGAVVGSHVFLSAASFLRLQSTDDIFNDRYAELDPLDDTRIHPIDEYVTARKMCRDAQDEDGGEEHKARELTLEETLEDLDLEAYAYILGEGGRPRMLLHLEWSKWEMIRPYADPRIPCKAMPLSVVLRALINDETKCRPTASVQLVVESTTPTLQLLALPSNTFGRIVDMAGGPYTRSQIIRTRLQRLNYDELCSYCVATSRGIASVFEEAGPQLAHDPAVLSPLIHEDIQVARANRGRRMLAPTSEGGARESVPGASTPVSGPRHVRHPCMSNLSHRELLHQLSGMTDPALPLGTVCKFRIGQQKDNLILYMLVNHSPFRFKSIPIEERGGPPVDRASVAKELHLQGIGTYTSLNEIIARPCSSFQTFIRDVLSHEKFHAVETIDDLEVDMPMPADGRAQWALVLDPQGADPHRFSERFLIVTISVSSRTGAKRIIKDSLVVSPNGYRIWSQQSSSLQHLLNWYKSKGYPNVSMQRQALFIL